MALLFDKKEEIPAEEITVLIPEARRRKHRRRLRSGIIVIIVSTVVILTSIYVGGLGRHPLINSSTNTAPTKGSVAVLPVGRMINASSVAAIQMFSPTRGVAISTFWKRSHSTVEHSYLTTTSDGGISWRVGGLLPAGTAKPGFGLNAMVAFFSPQVGYVATNYPRTFLFTSDGGRTWSKVAVPGTPTALWASNGQLLVTTERCANYSATPYCAITYLSKVRPGSLAASSALRIPSVLSTSSSAGTTISAYPATVIAWHGSTGLAVEDYLSSEHGAHLLATANSGATWRPFINPCPQGGQPFAQTISASHWYLMCSGAGALGVAPNWLYRTDDAGRSWKLLAQGSILDRGPNIGNLGDMSVNSFGASSDGKYLWIDGGSGYLESSPDGGRQWHFVGPGKVSAMLGIMGPYFVSVGNDGWMPISVGGLARTTDGISWNVVSESSIP